MSGEKRKMSVGLVEGLKMTTSIQNAIYPVADSVPFPCDVLTRERLAWIQRREATATLVSLTMQCRDRYHYALRLIHPGRPVPETARFPPNETVACLLPAWDWLCCWYRDVQFDPQLDLFTCPWRGELDRWYRFVRDRCEAVILDRPEEVRRILIATGIIAPDTTRVARAVGGFSHLLRQITKENEGHVPPAHDY